MNLSKIECVHRFYSIIRALLKGQWFLFPKLNTSLLRIYGKVTVRGPKNRIRIGNQVIFHGNTTLICSWDIPDLQIVIGDKVIFEDGNYLNAHSGQIVIGSNSFVGVGVVIQGKGGVYIGKETLLGPYVQIYSSDHTTDRTQIPRRQRSEVASPITIGRDVWIGANSILLRGTTLPEGSVVAAGSVIKTSACESALFANKNNLAVAARVLTLDGAKDKL